MIFKKKRVIKSIVFTVVTSILFIFLHSELGLFNSYVDCNQSYDYCEIVKTVYIKAVKHISNDYTFIHTDNSDLVILFDKSSLHSKEAAILESEHFVNPRKSTGILYFNQAFLI